MKDADAIFWKAYRIVLKKIRESKEEELAMLATILIMQMIGDEE